eukprot:CAMPEP_0119563650 /NCGR_PEP_ID=MMETSP1352-20130426/24211_1 /TAXON_ID=265584 /ORGANISM="Stauroneis constricta, Strain CCMP1120" /LENGTH=364 /DNA_ID=CAMNT_0007612287 /DNA_START=147 /DNA_END=1241 /DNA_ORIENTATION=+
MAPNLNSDDYYQVLGVPRGADDAALKKAYKKLAVKWHPDKNPGDETATKNFQKVSEAYATLSDSKKRQIYDQYGKDAANQADQMGEGGMPGHHHHGFPGGFGGGGGGFGPGGASHMSQADADRIFSHIFGGGDPFGGGFGGAGPQMRFGGGGPRGSVQMGGDPFSSMFGGMHPSMSQGGFGGQPHFQTRQQRQQRHRQAKRYDTIPTGTMVSLRGLVNKPERNGDRGEISSYDPSSGRYVVVLEDTEETMKVKPANLLQHVHVNIHGLESRTDLNGAEATVLAWNPTNERFNVYISSVSQAMSLRPANLLLQKGTVGQIVGIKAKPELNGRWGTINSWDKTTQRYDVQLSADKVIRVKMDNIRL